MSTPPGGSSPPPGAPPAAQGASGQDSPIGDEPSQTRQSAAEMFASMRGELEERDPSSRSALLSLATDPDEQQVNLINELSTVLAEQQAIYQQPGGWDHNTDVLEAARTLQALKSHPASISGGRRPS